MTNTITFFCILFGVIYRFDTGAKPSVGSASNNILLITFFTPQRSENPFSAGVEIAENLLPLHRPNRALPHLPPAAKSAPRRVSISQPKGCFFFVHTQRELNRLIWYNRTKQNVEKIMDSKSSSEKMISGSRARVSLGFISSED